MASAINLGEFREKLIRAFPPQPFYGVVSTHHECNEGIALRQELPGRRWDEIPAAFMDFNPGSLPLLEPDGLVAFLPAWLLRSMETFGHHSVLLELTMYFLCPGNEDEGWDEKGIAEMVSLFNVAQRCRASAPASMKARLPRATNPQRSSHACG